MADEQVSIEVLSVPEQPLDHDNKRKLGDLEVEAPDTVDTEPKSDEDNEDGNEKDNAEKDAQSELKRPRLGTSENGTENGHQDKVDKLGELEGKADQQPESHDDIVTGDSDSREQTQEAAASSDIEKVVGADGQAHEAVEKERSSGPIVEQNIDNENEDAKQEGLQPSSAINQDEDDSAAGHKKEGSQDQVRKIEVSNSKVGVLIGKGGDTIRYLQFNSGAKIQIMRDAEADPDAVTRPVELIGTLESIEKAEKLINDVIAEADAGGSPSLVARGFSTVQSVVGDQVEIQVPNEKVGLIIGKGGDTIKNLQTRSGARIQLVPQHLPSGDQSKERTVRITGDKKQIEVAREMIKEVMNQNVRPSPLSGGHGQQAFRPRGPVAPQWGQRNPYPSQFMGYDYPQRGPYQSQSQQYPPLYGSFPPQQTSRGSYGPGWEQRPPSAMQGPPTQQNYNYGQPQGPDYGHPGPHSQVSAQSYGQGGYKEMRYDNIAPAQHPYGGPGVSQQSGYHHGGGLPTGYGPQDHYGRPAPYGMQPQQPQGQTYGQPRPSQPENPYQAPVSSAQPYSSNVPPQQSYPYASSGAMQQSYPMYGSGPTPDGYAQPAPAATPVYPQQGGQPVSGYGQPGAQQASGYSAGGSTAGYGSYPSQPGYAEQPAVSNAAYGYQATADSAAYASSVQGSTAYAAPTAAQTGYGQPAPAQPGYDQSVAQSGGYGTAAAPAGYGKNLSPQPGYAQYDSSQMYGAPR